MQTFEERERAAYMSGDAQTAELYGELADMKQEVQELDGALENLPTEDEYSALQQDLDNYEKFFFGCFERLHARYPAPSVTSDYDCGVIFDAIEAGEAARSKTQTAYLLWMPGPLGDPQLQSVSLTYEAAEKIMREEYGPDEGAFITNMEVE